MGLALKTGRTLEMDGLEPMIGNPVAHNGPLSVPGLSSIGPGR